MHPWLVYGDTFRAPTYFTCLMIGFALATIVLRREARREGLPVRTVLDLALVLVPVVLLGSRLAHLLVVAPNLAWEDPFSALQLAYGGFIFYGGLAAAAVTVGVWSRRTGISGWRLGDVFAPATAFGLMFGRLGCLGGGCCYGRPADWPFGMRVPWAITYYRRGQLPEDLLAVPLHPTPLYEIALAWSLFVGLSVLRGRQRFEGEVMLAFLALYGVGRSLIEVFRADATRGLYFGDWVSTSQILGMTSAAVAVGVWARKSRV